MKKWSKLLSVLFVLLLIISSCSILPVSAGNTMISGIWEYTVDSQGKAEIVTSTQTTGDLVIPSTIDEYPVTTIKARAFRESEINSVVISEGIEKIEASAFAGCSNLSEVDIPDSVREIGIGAFEDVKCGEWEEGIFYVDNCAVDTLETTKRTAFSIREGTTHLSAWLFESVCDTVLEIQLPESLKCISSLAFSKCTKLKALDIPEGVVYLGDHGTFEKCESLESVMIPKGIDFIGKRTFASCKALKTLSIPDSVTYIDDEAFYYCSNLKSINLPASITIIEDSVFAGCGSLESISIPEGTTSIGVNAFGKCEKLTEIKVPESVTKLYAGVFANCTNLDSVTLPGNLTYIGEDVLTGTAYVAENDNWEDGLLYYGNYLLDVESSLTGPVIIKDNIKVVADSAFMDCSVTSVTLPAGVSVIPAYAFYNCKNLESVNFLGEITDIGSQAFSYCESLKSFIWPDNVPVIKNGTFFGCKSMSYVFIPETVNEIEYNAFVNCYALKSVTIPESVIYIASRALGYYDEYVYDWDWTQGPIEGFKIKGFEFSIAQSYGSDKFEFVKLIHSDILGDADLSGELSIKDATLIQKHIAEIEKPYDEQVRLSDTDKDGFVAIKDATVIQKQLADI